MTQVKTEVRLVGSVDPEHITRQLKMSPDFTWKPGDKVMAGKQLNTNHKDYGWVLTSGWQDTLDLGSQAQKTLDRLNYRIGLLRQWAENNRQKFELELACSIDFKSNDTMPSINFSPILLARVASLEMSIDVDVIFSQA